MDGTSESVAFAQSGSDRLRSSDANRRSTELAANFVAAAQVAILTLALLAELDESGTPSIVSYIDGVIIICGFSIAAIYWATTWRAAGFRSICEEIARRGLHVAALTFIATVVSSLVRDANYHVGGSTRTFALLLTIAWSSIGISMIVDQLCRRRSAQCVMVLGDGRAALELSQTVMREMPHAKVCIWPVAKQPFVNLESSPNTPAYAHPTIVELAPNVAIISGTTSDAAIADLTCHMAPFAIDVLVEAPHSSRRTTGAVVSFAGLPCLRVFPRPLALHQQALKRSFDIAASTTLIVLLLPVFLIIAFIVRIDSHGPALFRQPRVGRHGTHFVIWKFRTMAAQVADLLADSPTISNDPRLTRFGAFLRKTSLDELPQLFNVLLGSMSLVGPRPHAMNGNLFNSVMANYPARHRVRPGITGLAQVSGWRGPTDTTAKIEQRVANDLRYIGEWSLMRDVLILFRTVFAVCGKNAF